MHESASGRQAHPYRASEHSPSEAAKKGVSWLSRSVTGRRLGQALLAAGLTVAPSELVQDQPPLAHSSTNHPDKLRTSSEKAPSLTVTGVEGEWGIPNALYRSWLQASFPRILTQEHLGAVQFAAHPASHAHEARLHTSRSQRSHRLMGQVATQPDGRYSISLFQAATQESDPTLIPPPGTVVSFSENASESPDAQFENALRLQIRAFSGALLAHVPAEQFQRVNERLTREIHDAGFRTGSSDRLFSSHDRYQGDSTAAYSSWGILLGAAEEAFLQSPEATPEAFTQEVVTRLRGHLYGAARPEVVDKLMKAVYHELEQMMHVVNPHFSFANTAAARVARTNEMRVAHRTHRVELVMTQLIADPILRAQALRFARAPHPVETAVEERIQRQDQLHAHFTAPERQTAAHLAIHPYSPSELAMIAWENLLHTLRGSHTDTAGYHQLIDSLQLFHREWQQVSPAQRSRLTSELSALSSPSL
ncbi:hypothetical protein KBA73_00990 [Patescibacteria group bacterium]|nr:hypothetical protein [Patescibacteria group bacterium]